MLSAALVLLAGIVTSVIYLSRPQLPPVPEELDKTTFVQYAKDWTQILAQFALGVAAFVTLTD